MAKLSINMEPRVQESLMYCYTVGEFKKRYLPILNLLNNCTEGDVSSFAHYYLKIKQLVASSSDDALLSVSTAKHILNILNNFIKEYKSVTFEKDKVGFAEEITECLQSRNKYIEDLLDVGATENKTEPKDFLIDLKMLEPYKDVDEFKPIIAALEEKQTGYSGQHTNCEVTIQCKVIDEQPITDFVNQNKNHQWYDSIVSSYSQRLKLFGILYNDLVSCSRISTVENFKTFYKNVLEKLYKKDDGGKSHKYKNWFGNSLDRTIDAIRTKMDNSCDLSDDDEKTKKGISTLRSFAIEKLKAYYTKNPKTSPNKKAIVAEIVRKLEQAEEEKRLDKNESNSNTD